VQAVDRVDGEAIEQAVLDQRRSARADFLGWLKDEMQDATKRARVRKSPSGRQ
jgi:hypothetical protein